MNEGKLAGAKRSQVLNWYIYQKLPSDTVSPLTQQRVARIFFGK